MSYIPYRDDGRRRCYSMGRRRGRMGIQCSLPDGHYGRHMHPHWGYWTTAQADAEYAKSVEAK